MKNKSVLPFANTKILVVEDDELGHTIITNILEKLGCKVDVAEYGREALKFLDQNIYDLVFMDIAIIDLDGFTITEHLRQIENETKRKPTPVIAISAYNESSFKKRAAAVGINDYLIKPVPVKKYQEILEKFLTK